MEGQKGVAWPRTSKFSSPSLAHEIAGCREEAKAQPRPAQARQWSVNLPDVGYVQQHTHRYPRKRWRRRDETSRRRRAVGWDGAMNFSKCGRSGAVRHNRGPSVWGGVVGWWSRGDGSGSGCGRLQGEAVREMEKDSWGDKEKEGGVRGWMQNELSQMKQSGGAKEKKGKREALWGVCNDAELIGESGREGNAWSQWSRQIKVQN